MAKLEDEQIVAAQYQKRIKELPVEIQVYLDFLSVHEVISCLIIQCNVK